MASTASAPPDRQLGGETGAIGDSSRDFFGSIMDNADSFAQDALGWYPKIAEAERDATGLQRHRDLLDFQRMGPKFFEAFKSANPGFGSALDAVNARVQRGPSPLLNQLNTSAMAGITNADAAGPSAIRQNLEGQALGELQLGRSLSPEELRASDQGTRAAWAARGLGNTSQSAVSEVLNRDAYGTQREAGRRQFAAGVQGLAQNEDMSLENRQIAARNSGMGVQGLNAQQDAYGLSALQANQSAMSPILGFFGRTGVSPLAGSQLLGGSSQLVSGYAPLLSYGSDLFNTNYNAQAASNINNANAQNALTGSIISAVGSLAGAAAMCWVAREIFGEEKTRMSGGLRPTWLIFKQWLSTRAPKWFYNLYLRHGERFAGWLRGHPRVKALVRPWMAARVAGEVEFTECYHEEVAALARRRRGAAFDY